MKYTNKAAVTWFALALTATSLAQATKSTDDIHTIALTPGTCVSIHENDIVTFEWNPSFDSPATGVGLQNFSLFFALRGEEKLGSNGGGVVLSTIGSKTDNPTNVAISDGGNGFFRMRFRVHLRDSQPGQYSLVRADAEPILPAGFAGVRPAMTNTPLTRPFCLNVLQAPSRRGQ